MVKWLKQVHAMMGSVDDANKAKEQIGLLASNLGKLNSVYGNMLSAMQAKVNYSVNSRYEIKSL